MTNINIKNTIPRSFFSFAAFYVVCFVGTIIDSSAANLAVSDGKIYTNAKVTKVQKPNNNIYFKIIYPGGTRLIKPTDLKPVNIILKDGTHYGEAQITDIMSDSISIYTSGTPVIIKFDELSEESLEIFEIPKKGKEKKQAIPEQESKQIISKEPENNKKP